MSYFEVTFSESKNHTMNYLHSHDFFEFYFQFAGTRKYFCDNKYYELQEHSFIVIPPHTLHKFEGGPYKKFGIFFSIDKLPIDQHPLLTKLAEKHVIQFPKNKMQQIQRTLNKIFQLYNLEKTKDKHLQISLWFGYLMHQIYLTNITEQSSRIGLINTNLNTDLSPTILKIMDYIQINYNTNLTLEQICKRFNLSRSWISKVFFDANGLTIFQYKLKLQLNKAKDLLTSTTYSSDKIAQITGFSNANYFSKVFKKNTGNSPIAFRNAYQKQRSKLTPQN